LRRAKVEERVAQIDDEVVVEEPERRREQLAQPRRGRQLADARHAVQHEYSLRHGN